MSDNSLRVGHEVALAAAQDLTPEVELAGLEPATSRR
jgi:hypothetical protein